ncbi:O-antigen ligase family protein [Micromonospora sp. WMMA1998]|uniref:O-antigen ligase family protein n=1 Tax=Micromonospora sp. WMMA1998 TaxID=3015167 RepID=UPI00248C5146|nr:O-antigen ligase family protein [Micromonospora sp. WMMA1998]WBC14307.1 O-antigen ligase family protein [Micromonospora sp. WMMA1998]
MRVWADRITGGERRTRYLGAGVVVLATGLLVTGRWQLALGVGVGALLGWVMLEPVRITWAVFVIAFAVPVTIDPGYPTNPSYTLLLVLFVLAAWGRVVRAERDGWPPRALAAVLVLPTCAVLAGLVHWHGVKPVAVGVAPLLCFGVLGWHLVEEARHDWRPILRIAETLTWFSVAVAVFAKYQTVSRSWPIFDQFAYDWTYTSAFDATRAVGVSGHPIIYGTFAMAMALVALTLRGRFWYVPVAANLVGLVLSGTRSAWVGTILALGFWLFLQWRKVTWRGLGSAVAITAVTCALVAVNPSALLPAGTDPTSTAQNTQAVPPPSPAVPPSSPAVPPSSPAVPASSPAVPASSPAVPASSPAAPASSPAAPPSSADAAGPQDSVDVAGSRISDPASADARFTRITVVWAGITRDWSTFVFGNGPEANVRYLENVGIGDGQAQVFDNTYLTFWYNFGLIGLACLLALLVVLYRRLRSLPARVLLVGFAAQIFFFDVWLWLGAVAVLLLAVALGAAEDPSLSARPAPDPHRPDPAAGVRTDAALAPDTGAVPGRP